MLLRMNVKCNSNAEPHPLVSPFCLILFGSCFAYILDGDPKEYGNPINKHFQEGNTVGIRCFWISHNMKQFDCLKLNS